MSILQMILFIYCMIAVLYFIYLALLVEGTITIGKHTFNSGSAKFVVLVFVLSIIWPITWILNFINSKEDK